MKRSVDRIMTTHGGSLPRPSDLVELYRDDAPDNKLLRPIEVPYIDRGHVKSLEHLDLIGMTFGRRHSKHQLQREPWCRLCRARGETTVATVVDHIHPHHGDVNQFWCGELQSLCRPCHDSEKKFTENRGFDNTIGADGMPLDPRHPIYTGRLPEKKPPTPPVDPVSALITAAKQSR